MSPNGDHYAIVIGIENYPSFGRVEGASKDAGAFASWLLEEGGGALPGQNVHALVSPPTPPSGSASAHPQQYEVTRALNYLGLPTGRHIGERLYVFIRGLATTQGDDFSILTADARSEDLRGFRLHEVMHLLRHGNAFDELVVLAELDLLLPGAAASTPTYPDLLPRRSAKPPKEVSIVVNHTGRPALPAADAAGKWPGLAMLWIEAMKGKARDPRGGGITGENIVYYVQQASDRATITAREANGIVFGEDTPQGRLILELPHWMTTVRITNGLMQPVGELKPLTPQGAGEQASFEAEIAPGIYRIEATLENRTEQQTVIVAPGSTVRLEAKSWKSLKPMSAAPLGGMFAAKPAHIEKAEAWSRSDTWKRHAGAGSRLFLFVRALEPPASSDLMSGLRLLDAQGALVTDFSNSIVRDAKSACAAFNARLPPGSYVLCRDSRPGVQVRQQPLFLHAGWETQCFVVAKRVKPSLRTMLIHMAELDKGFSHTDEIAIAVDAVMDVLRHESSPEILQREQVAHLLGHEYSNPWLGVLAAYVMLREAQDPGQVSRESELMSRIRSVADFLKTTIGDHPDVRALALDETSPAGQPFWHPPLLRAGLKLVQRHSTRHRGTVPLDSLTDCVLGSLVTNAPWTAWRTLDRAPRYSEHTDTGGDGDKRARRRRAAPAPASLTAILGQEFSPAAPIFRLGGGASDPVTDFDALRDATLIGTARGLMEKVGGTIAPVVTLDMSKVLEHLSPEQVSRVIGASIERSTAGLERLRPSGGTPDASATGGGDRGVTQAALATAARTAAGRLGVIVGAAADVAGDVATDAAAGGSSRVTVENIGAELRISAARVASAADPLRPDEAHELTRRLENVADQLLEVAYFVAVADGNAQLRYGNGALLSLVSHGADAATYNAALQAWNDAMKSAPLGRSEIINPLTAPKMGAAAPRRPLGAAPTGDWVLHRTQVEDSISGVVLGYVNILLPKNSKVLSPETLPQIESKLSELRLYSSLYTREPRAASPFLGRIGSLTDHIEGLLS